MKLGGSGRAQEAARIQDKGDFLGFHVISHGRGGYPDSGQETKGLWAREDTGQTRLYSPGSGCLIIHESHCF